MQVTDFANKNQILVREDCPTWVSTINGLYSL
jgi:hypothetical protein